MGQKIMNVIWIWQEFRVSGLLLCSESNKSNYKFYTKILKQNALIAQIKYIYINLKLDNKNYMHNL